MRRALRRCGLVLVALMFTAGCAHNRPLFFPSDTGAAARAPSARVAAPSAGVQVGAPSKLTPGVGFRDDAGPLYVPR